MKSRTLASLQNSRVTFFYYIVNLIVNVISRKFFLDYLGSEILGLNTTILSLLNILNLSELGIGTAVAYTLYRPLLQKDHGTINEIMTIQGWLYRKIAFVILAASLILMMFFPFIFAKSALPSGYIYASFLVFLYSSLLTYYYNYKQTLLIANQQQYLVVYNYHSILLLKSIVQILVVALLPHPYVWWLVLHVVFVTLATWNLERAIKRTFPYFNMYWKEGEILYKRYSHLMTKVKQVFFHHVASFALTRSSSIIIYAYTSLTLVTLYENYLLVITAVQSLSNSIFGGIYAGVGNLVAEGNKQRIMRVFKELFSIRFFLSCVCCYGVLEVMEPLICLWIGEQYLLPQKTLYLATAILYINLSRQAVEIFIAAHGMYQDIAAPIIESVLNIVLSCWFGYMWGINGVLLGVLVSLIVIVLCWKPYFLFRFGLKCSLLKYIWMYAVHFCCMLLTCIVTTYFFKLVPFSPVSDIWSLLFIGLIHIIFFSLLLGGILWIFVPEMKMFCQRIIQLLKS